MMNFRQYRFLSRLTAVLVCLLIALFIYTTINRLNSNRSFIVETQTSRLETVNKLAAAELMDYFGKIKLSLKTADFWLKNHPGADPRFDKDFISLINLLETDMSGNVKIRLVSNTGQLYYIPAASTKPLADVQDRAYYKMQQNPSTRGLYIGEPILSRVTHRWGIPISYPLDGAPGGISVIFASLELPTLEKLLDPYLMKQGGSMLLVRTDGVVLMTSPFEEKTLGTSPGFAKQWHSLIVNPTNSKVHILKTMDSINRYVTSQQVSGFPITVVSSCSVGLVLDPWINSLFPNIVAMVLLIIAFAFLGFMMLKLLRRMDYTLYDVTHISNTDHLTGLYNRRFFSGQLKQELLRSQRYGSSFAIAQMDIDYFKTVNDTYGHEAGDQLLVALSNLISTNLRESDVVSRWGGEEFMLLFVNANLAIAHNCVEKLRSLIENHDFGEIGKITCSFGLAEHTQGESAQHLLERVDKLLYKSKNRGRNQVSE